MQAKMALSRLYLATARLHLQSKGFAKPKRGFCSSSKNRSSRSSKSSAALKEERALQVEAIVKKYMAAHSGNFPKAKQVHDEVHGSWYILKDILTELKEKLISKSNGHITGEPSFSLVVKSEDRAKENLTSTDLDELESTGQSLGSHSKPIIDHESNTEISSQYLCSTNSQILSDIDSTKTLINNSVSDSIDLSVKNIEMSSDSNLGSYQKNRSLKLEDVVKEGNLTSGEFDELESIDQPLQAHLETVIDQESAQKYLRLSNLFGAKPRKFIEELVTAEKKLESNKSSGAKESPSLNFSTDEPASGDLDGSDGNQRRKRLQNWIREISNDLPKAKEEKRFSDIHIDKNTQTEKMGKTRNSLFDMVIKAVQSASKDDGKGDYDNASLDHQESRPSEDVEPESVSDQNNIVLKFLPKWATEADIAKLFGDCGPIEEIHIINSRKENKFNYARVSFKTEMGLQKALDKANFTLNGADIIVQAASPFLKNTETVSAPKPNLGNVPPTLLKNPTRTVMIKGLPDSLAPHDLSVLSFGRISGFIMGSSASTGYIEFETEEAKEKALAASSMSISGSLVSFLRIDMPGTTVLRISNIDPDVDETRICRICNTYGRVKKLVRRDTDIVDVHFDLSEWARMVKIIKSLSHVVINQSKWIAQPATVFPPEILQAHLSSPDGREYVHSAIRNLCRRISEDSLDTSQISEFAEDYYGEESYAREEKREF